MGAYRMKTTTSALFWPRIVVVLASLSLTFHLVRYALQPRLTFVALSAFALPLGLLCLGGAMAFARTRSPGYVLLIGSSMLLMAVSIAGMVLR